MATIWSVDELVEASAVNPIEEIDKKYYEYGPGFGYYILSNVYKNFDKFREVVRSCPVYPNIMSKLNPFYTGTVPDPLVAKVRDTLSTEKWHTPVSSYINYYHHSIITATKAQAWPHSDSFEGSGRVLVCNGWLSEHNPKNKTCFYYNKKTGKYTWTEKEYASAVPNWRRRADNKFRNFVEDDTLVKVAEAPTEPGTISIYFSDQIHAPHVDYDAKDERHSYVLMFGDNAYMQDTGGPDENALKPPNSMSGMLL